MYSSRGSGAYGQSYPGQSAYGQNLGSNFTGASVGGHDVGQHSVASRHSAILGASQEVDVAGYRPHSSTAAQYGGQYSAVYGSSALSSAQQVPSLGTKGASSSALDGRGGYNLGVSDSPKFASGEYVPSSGHGYGHKVDQLYGDKGLEYSGIDRRQYGERQSAYIGRDLGDAAGRYAADPIGFSHQHQQAEIYDRIDQAALLRQEQLLKAQPLQAASLDGGARQADYLAARTAASRHTAQDLLSYGGRIDSDPRASSMLSAASYSGQHAPSILGAAPRRNLDDLLYSQNASNPGYGVSLPPGRDYASGKALHGNAMELDYPGNALSRGGHNDLKDDRASYLREFELREEERRRERLRERERDREREKERERLREREREKERERERERERILERREKERERERKRALETKRDRTPVRSSKDPRGTSKDPRGSSLTKDGRSSRRDSPHHVASHRHHSPVREKRREYVCKVYPARLVDIERDYLSIDRRYPRLFVSPEFSKVVVNWPKENLKLSIHTPVSFEHDFIEEGSFTETRESSDKLLMGQPPNSIQGNTVWNAKIILMSGLSRGALEELSSDKILDDRIPHICSFLKFAVLKKDHSFMAVGGPWEPVDGGDPSVDDNSLIRTALRYAKDVIQLDLRNCQQWNRFLEIHYDRLGKDGFFSHKEITVLYVPNLSDCLPKLDEWREHWLAHKKAVVERARQLALKRENTRDSKEASKDKLDKKKESASSGQSGDAKKKEKDSNNVKVEAEEKTAVDKSKTTKHDGSDIGEGGKNAEKKQPEADACQTSGSVKSVKKKVIRKVVKQKVVNKANDATNKQLGKSDEKNGVEKTETSTVLVEGEKSSVGPDGIQDATNNVVSKDIIMNNTDGEEGKDKDMISSEDKPLDKPETVGNATIKTIKKKIIKRVPKKVVGEASRTLPETKTGGNVEAVKAEDGTQSTSKQIAGAGIAATQGKKAVKVVPKKKLKTPTGVKQNDTSASNKTETKSDKDDKKSEENVVAGQPQDVTQNKGRRTADADTSVTELKKTVKVVSKNKSKETSEKQDGAADSNKNEMKSNKDGIKDEKDVGKIGAKLDKQKASEKDVHNVKGKLKDGDKAKDMKGTKDGDKLKDMKGTKERDGKDESRSKSSRELKEKKKSDEPPRHPGFVLQTKWTKDSKLRSLSLSLDSLLDYTDKDVEESTLELSLFAESFHEMLQFQMGCRILAFLQKLRIKFVTKRAQRKRQREESHEKDSESKSPSKRTKKDNPPVKSEPADMDTTVPTEGDDDKTVVQKDKPGGEKEEDKPVEKEDVKMEDGSDEEEDPEEDPEEYDEMENGSPQHDSSEYKNAEQEANADVESKNITGNEKAAESSKEETKVIIEEVKESKSDAHSTEEKEGKVDKIKKEAPAVKEAVVDKELLQAFRFFDRNQAGYIRVEDMRLVVHNLGMFLSHRDVKELVQSALLESNTGRDDRILYNKLVRMTDV
ncbi:protein SHORT ROOT IN SALT MEDIUM 1 [Arachis stenosperma]|uniref:protein SHORT ROOT IN SALT MEDIUM 1 n=1 Tax=Arachis stenosperma TaxID=217475 RepID=UPI0025AB929F|nr:protein SHORT ROOT IN SALT MEDIUM 1 [Arachis stenosperma]XP_057726341.1 protein SHORT ROOT IN SALT MEDIUM 1 [Arachis stenosperma]